MYCTTPSRVCSFSELQAYKNLKSLRGSSNKLSKVTKQICQHGLKSSLSSELRLFSQSSVD